MENSDQHFRTFAASLERCISKYEHLTEQDITAVQCNQVETLIKLENEFMARLKKTKFHEVAWAKFCDHILDNKKNILKSRPYFRERQSQFKGKITTAFRCRDYNELSKFSINYRFINFVARNVGIPKTHIIWKTIKKIESLRTELVEMNIPLAINRASIFWRRAKRSRTHLSFMDLIQMAVEGLLTCVDKFTPPYTEVWRSVAIGNMVGNFIEANSATILHLFPGDRKTLYRANKYISKNSANLNFEAMVEFINEQPENQKTPVTKKVRKEEVAKLLLATSIVSLDTKAPGDEQTTTAVKGISRMTASDDVRPDVAVEKAETSIALKTAVKSLTPYERKVLKLFYGGYFE